jgi:hypothetical protein
MTRAVVPRVKVTAFFLPIDREDAVPMAERAAEALNKLGFTVRVEVELPPPEEREVRG